MADNYLEQKFEDLRNGRLHSAKPLTWRNFKGTLWIPDIAAVDSEKLRSLVREGWRVYFGGEEPNKCHRLAKTLHCIYLPAGMQPPEDYTLLSL